jgi:hypothetical protein
MINVTPIVPRIFVTIVFCASIVTSVLAQEKPVVFDRLASISRGTQLVAADEVAKKLADHTADNERSGFYIGMAIAENHTYPGPGKSRTCASLTELEARSCEVGVTYSVERNRNIALITRGRAIVEADPAIAAERTRVVRVGPRYYLAVFLGLGFDIGAAAAEGQTQPGPGKDKTRDSLNIWLRDGFNAAVSFTLERNRNNAALGATTETTDGRWTDRAGSNSATTAGPPPDRVVSREIRCRGYAKTGGSEYVFFTINSRPSPTGETLVTYEIAFSPDTRAAGTRGENLRPGFCAFVDRPISASGPYRIRFETVANAQLKQAQHGSSIDRSSTAAESYPDVNTIPVYLKGENHYWSFGGVTDSGRGYFVASGNGFWKPAIAIDNVPGNPTEPARHPNTTQSPTEPARRRPYPTKP